MGAKEQIALAALKALVPVLVNVVNSKEATVSTDPNTNLTESEARLAKISHGLSILETILEAI
jgi:hypothetical protein